MKNTHEVVITTKFFSDLRPYDYGTQEYWQAYGTVTLDDGTLLVNEGARAKTQNRAIRRVKRKVRRKLRTRTPELVTIKY